MRWIKHKEIVLGILLGLALQGCSGSSGNSPALSQKPDISIGQGDPFVPFNNPDPTISGIPQEESCETSLSVSINPTTINFGFNQIDTSDSKTHSKTQECQKLVTNGCEEFEVEIDDFQEPANHDQFFLKTRSAQTTGRTDLKSGITEVCYRRKLIGTHKGRVNVVSKNSIYATSIPVEGMTENEIFSISSPIKNLIVWEDTHGSPLEAEPSAPYLSYFRVQAAGSVNLGTYGEMLKKREVGISVKEGGRTTFFPIEDSGNFSGPIEIPASPALYSVNFSIRTDKSTLTKKIPVIRFTQPTGFFKIRDAEGNDIHILSESNLTPRLGSGANTRNIILGLIVDNLSISGPNEAHKLDISITKAENKDGANAVVIPIENQTSFPLYVDQDFSSHEGINRCRRQFNKTGEDPNRVICTEIQTASLKKGINYFFVKACNRYTRWQQQQDPLKPECKIFEAKVIVDNSKPIITLTSPQDKKRYEPGAPIQLTGTIENFTPYKEFLNAETNKMEKRCILKAWLNQSYLSNPPMPSLFENDQDKNLCEKIKYDSKDVETDPATGNLGNVKRAEFKADVNLPNEALTLYTNVFRIQAVNNSGHDTVKVVAFRIGTLNKSAPRSFEDGWIQRMEMPSLVSRLISGLGEVEKNTLDGKVVRAPLLLNLSEGLVKNENSATGLREEVIFVLEKLLNDKKSGLKFADILQGGKLPGDKNGNNKEDPDETIDFEKDLMEATKATNFWDTEKISDTQRQRWIWENLHGGMPQKARALAHYRVYEAQRGRAQSGQLENVRFKGLCETRNPEDPETGWEVSCDSCRNKISSALVSYDTLQYVYRGISNPLSLPRRRDWPGVCGTDLNCNKTEQGLWKIGHVDLKANGFIDAEICLVGEGDKVDGCDDLPDSDNHKPAFWGFYSAMALIQGGITGDENDPLLPLLWNVGKLRINLQNALQVIKERLPNGTFTNRVILHKDRLIDGIQGSIQLEPYLKCAEYYRAQYGNNYPTPFGCNPNGSVFPVLIDRSSLAGQAAVHDYGEPDRNGNPRNMFLLEILRNELLKTFKNLFHCMVKEALNPIINPVAFPYPNWVAEKNQIDLTFALDKVNDKIKIKRLNSKSDPPTNPIFSFGLNLKNVDLLVNEDNLAMRVPLEIGALNLPLSNYNPEWGHLFRRVLPGFDFKPIPDSERDNPFASISLGIEEVMNSATHLLLRKGVRSILDLLNFDKLDPPSDHPVNDWTIGIDKVIFSRLDICDTIAGGEGGAAALLDTKLDALSLLTGISDLFEGDGTTHWDITLDPDSPPTLLMLRDPSQENASVLQIGLSNVIVSLYDLLLDSDSTNIFRIASEPVAKIRLDGLLKIALAYDRDSREVIIRIRPLSETPLYLSVLPTARNISFRDSDVLDAPTNTLIKNAFDKLATDPGFIIRLPDRLTYFEKNKSVKTESEYLNSIRNLKEILIYTKANLGENGSCEGKQKPRYFTDLPTVGEVLEDAINNNPWQGLMNTLQEGGSASNNQDMKEEEKTFIESLNEKGINEIEFGKDGDGKNYPDLEIDFTNGYLHLNTKAIIEIFSGTTE